MMAALKSKVRRPAILRNRKRPELLVGAICLALCAIMLAPFVLSVSASLKTTQEASTIPPTYFTHQLSLDSYQRLWSYQAGRLLAERSG